jgi:hypothetical protein
MGLTAMAAGGGATKAAPGPSEPKIGFIKNKRRDDSLALSR